MKNRILTEIILAGFYFTGGTALSAFYLEHRFSQDLDLFTDTEKNMPPIEFLTGLMGKLPSLNDIRYERLFDRRIFVATFKDGDALKVEFTTYPF